MKSFRFYGRCVFTVVLLALTGLAPHARGAANEAVVALAKQEKAPLLDTLKELVAIESGSGDR